MRAHEGDVVKMRTPPARKEIEIVKVRVCMTLIDVVAALARLRLIKVCS